MEGASDRMRTLLREMYRHRAYYLIILPAIVCFIVVKYIPIGGIVLAFKNYTITGGIWGSEWAGFKYFERMLGSADFLHPLPWMAVAVGASDADVEE